MPGQGVMAHSRNAQAACTILHALLQILNLSISCIIEKALVARFLIFPEPIMDCSTITSCKCGPAAQRSEVKMLRLHATCQARCMQERAPSG